MARVIKDSFNLASDSYNYRVPYHAGMFDALSKELAAGRRTGTILDVCCGQGQLSLGMAERGWRAIGIDFSEQMIARAARHDRIDYLLHDINASDRLPASIAGDAFDHFVIGRAIHWIEERSLQAVIAANLAAGGTMVICGSGFTAATPWLAAFQQLREAYSHREARNDLSGRQKLARLGFQPVRRISVDFRLPVTLDILVRHALSYGRSTELISANLDEFRRKLAAITAPYEQGIGQQDTELSGVATSWALIYARAPAA